MEKISSVIRFRSANTDDIPFLANSMFHSLQHRRDLISKLIHHWIDKDNILIATSLLDSEQILGYICFNKEQLAVHFCYVKLPFRKLGICTAMMKKIGTIKYFTINCTRPDYLMRKYKVTLRPILLIESFV